jgi:hypothetical protein
MTSEEAQGILAGDRDQWLVEMLRRGFEASQRASGVSDRTIPPLVEKAVGVYVEMLGEETDSADMGLGELERLVRETKRNDPEDVHYKAAALYQVREII